MKKLLLVSALTLALTACGNEEKPTDKTATHSQADTTQTSTTDKVANQAPEQEAKPADSKEAAKTTDQAPAKEAKSAPVDSKSKESESTTEQAPAHQTKPADNKASDKSTEQAPATESKAPSFDKQAEVDSAKKITKNFAEALKGELVKAMQSGGPIAALDVCHEQAIPITMQSAKEQGAGISRVSLKNRNPDNAPNAWQSKILTQFDKRAADGEDIAKMAHAEVIETDGKKQLHFLKALPTNGLCLACHGSQLSDDVSAKVKELYPADKAVGYSENQVRGAIVVVKDIN